MALGEREGGGWERTLAAELLGSSGSQLLRLTFDGALPQTLAGSIRESLHVCSHPLKPAMHQSCRAAELHMCHACRCHVTCDRHGWLAACRIC